MTLKQEVAMLRSEVKELRMLTLQQAKLTDEMSIIIKGSETLGVEGIRVFQRREQMFRENVLKRLEVVDQIDNRVGEIEQKLKDVVEWKATWNKAIALISSSTTWKILFFIGLGIAGILIFTKFKLLGVVQALEQVIKK